MNLGLKRFLAAGPEEGESTALVDVTVNVNPASQGDGGCGCPGFDAFLRRLDAALARLIRSGGHDVRELEKTYNEHWPDGRRLSLSACADGGFEADFSSGQKVVFGGPDELGACALLMADPETYARADLEMPTEPETGTAGESCSSVVGGVTGDISETDG